MIRIVLSDDQVQALAEAEGPVDLVDSQGRRLGQFAPAPPGVSAVDLAEIRKRIAEAPEDKTSFTTWPEIKARLQAQENR